MFKENVEKKSRDNPIQTQQAIDEVRHKAFTKFFKEKEFKGSLAKPL
jgi:hypothetical protein